MKLKTEACKCCKFNIQTCRLNLQAVHLSPDVQMDLGVPVDPVFQAPLLVPLLWLVLEGLEGPGDRLGLAPLSALDKPVRTEELGLFSHRSGEMVHRLLMRSH